MYKRQGLPRPIHLDDGIKNIQQNRTTSWVEKQLINNIQVICDGDYLEEKTGLHELEFIETRRFTTSTITYHDCQEGVHMLNLVDGKEALVESPNHAFEPFVVHYAETFVIPSAIGKYTIRPVDNEKDVYKRQMLNSAIVIGGMNLPLALTTVLMKDAFDNDTLIKQILSEAQEGLKQVCITTDEEDDI